MKHAACILAVFSVLAFGFPKAPAFDAGSPATSVNALATASAQMVRNPLFEMPTDSYPNCTMRPMKPSRPTTTIISQA